MENERKVLNQSHVFAPLSCTFFSERPFALMFFALVMNVIGVIRCYPIIRQFRYPIILQFLESTESSLEVHIINAYFYQDNAFDPSVTKRYCLAHMW